MHYRSRFNALIMLCNAPYNALYILMNNCNHSYIITLINSLLHYAFKFRLFHLKHDILYYNAHYE